MTLALTTDAEPTDTSLPFFPNDAIIDSGTKCCFDYLDPNCNANATGALANGAPFINLVGTGANATAQINAGSLTNSNGIVFSTDTGTKYINAGAGYCPPAGHAFVAIVWVKMAAATMSNNDGAMSLGANTSSYLFTIEISGSGANLNFAVGGGSTGGGNSVSISVPAASTVHQLAVAYDPAGIMQAFADGALVGSAAAPLGANMIDYSANNLRFGADPASVCWNGGEVYRNVLSDLTVSGLKASAVVANDYAMNTGRFS